MAKDWTAELSTSFSASVRDLIARGNVVHSLPARSNHLSAVSTKLAAESQEYYQSDTSVMYESSITFARLTSSPCQNLWGPASQGHTNSVHLSMYLQAT